MNSVKIILASIILVSPCSLSPMRWYLEYGLQATRQPQEAHQPPVNTHNQLLAAQAVAHIQQQQQQQEARIQRLERELQEQRRQLNALAQAQPK